MTQHDPEFMRAIRLDAKLEACRELEQCIDSLERDYKNDLYKRAWKVVFNAFRSHILKQVQQRLTHGA